MVLGFCSFLTHSYLLLFALILSYLLLTTLDFSTQDLSLQIILETKFFLDSKNMQNPPKMQFDPIFFTLVHIGIFNLSLGESSIVGQSIQI